MMRILQTAMWQVIIGVCALANTSYAAVQLAEDGPIHEAFVTRSSGADILQAISTQPPAPINEHPPAQVSPNSTWIAGYWWWSTERNDFLWVSGVWRCSPPGHEWIPGFWQQFEEGWAYVHGFWSPLSKDQITYLSVPPPDALDEQVPAQNSNTFFWMPGYWKFDASAQQYSWVSGAWESLDPNWVYVPAQYTWRPEGYVFVPGHWDWPLNSCGQSYNCVFIPLDERATIVYEPDIILEPVIVIQRLFIYYPSYICFFHYHYCYHPDFWIAYPNTPPWWGWPTWWCYTWHDQWAVWWWYCHPGYPQPMWMNAQMSAKIAPPPQSLLKIVEKTKPPIIVTPNGVVPPKSLLSAISKEGKGKVQPILPSNPKLLSSIQNSIPGNIKDEKNILKPTGPKEKPGKTDIILQKPVTDPNAIKLIDKVKPIKPTLPTKPPLPTGQGKGDKPTLPIKPVKPVLPQDQVKPLEERKPVNPVKPVLPLDEVKPVKPVKPVVPQDQVKPLDDGKPVRPTKPVLPLDEVKPAKPVLPQNQVKSLDETKPVKPIKPILPQEQNKSLEPHVTPVQPVTPVNQQLQLQEHIKEQQKEQEKRKNKKN